MVSSTRRSSFVLMGSCTRVLTALAIVVAALVAGAPAAHATAGVCDTAGPIEVESVSPASGPTAYVSLVAAFAAINAGTHQGTITIDVCGSTVEVASAVLNASGAGGAVYGSIAMSPAGGASRSISGVITGPLVDLNGADNVTIDGLNTAGNALTLDNTSASATAATVRFIADASSNTIQNTTIKGAATSLGTVFFSAGSVTGNLGNVINANTITASTTTPVNAILSSGLSVAVANTASITNNNISDYFSATAASSGIQVSSNSTGWTITGNRFFQTANRTATTGATHRAINITTASGSGYTISNNVIGFANSAGTGSTVYLGAAANRFIGIELTAANAPASSIQGNTINGFTFSTTSGVTTAPGVFDGISVLAGGVNIGTTSANTIGASSGTGAINVTTTTSGAFIGGITAASTGVVSIQNNNIGAINTGGTAAIGYVFNGIQSSGAAGSFTISGNTIGSTTTASSVAIGLSGTTTAATTFVGITNAATGVISITGNTIQNCSSFGTGASVFTGVSNTGGSGTLSLSTNSIISGRNAGTGLSTGLSNSAAVATANINTNVFRSHAITSATGGITGISNTGAVTAAININNNQLGNASGGLVSFTVASSGTLTGVSNTAGSSAATLTISGNDIQGIAYSAASSGAHTYVSNSTFTGSTAITSNTFTNLNVNTTGNVTFITNSLTHAASTTHNVNNNAIVTGFNKGGAGGTVFFYDSFGSSPASVTENNTGNNFSNMTFTGATTISGWRTADGTTPGSRKTVTNNTFSGISTGAASVTILNVGFSDNTFATNNVSGNTISSITGALDVTGLTSSSGNQNFFGNTINTLTTSAAASTITALSITGGTTQNVFKNKIYDISESGANTTTTPAVNGLLLSAGTTVTAHDNLVGDLRAPSASLADAIRGISVTSTSTSTNYNVHYNTVFLSAAAGGANFGTTGVFHTVATTSTTAALSLRNNIIVNTSVQNGTGLAVAYRRSGGAASNLANYAAASNNNDFYAGSPGASRLIYADGTSTAQTITAYKGGVFTAGTIAPRDSASFSENPTFLSTTGSSASFLHINTASATQIESGAVNISGITDDYDNDIRQGNAGYGGTGSAPDVGADEFNGTPLDLTPPTITYTALIRDGVAATRSFSPVTVADASGVNTTAGTRPRVYYKKSTDTNAFNGNTSATAGWKFAEANGAGGSPFSFTIDYSLLSGGAGVSVGDTIQYFVVAQDLATTPNVGINAGTFAATPSSVALTAAAFPIGGTPSSYAIVATLSGTKTVCSGGCDYTSLTNAGGVFADINAKLLGGNLTVQIAGNLAGETGGNALAPPLESPAGPWTITIYPTGVARTVTGTGTGGTLIPILGADRVVIDGPIGGGGTDRSLTLSQTNTANGTGNVFIGSLGTGAGSTDITIKNCIIKAGNIGTTSNFTFGVFVGDSTGAAAGADNDNFTFQNNQILQARTGLQMTGTVAGVNDNAVISGNLIGDNTLATSIGRFGIVFSAANNATIGNNTIKNIFLTGDTSSAFGMSLSSLTSSSVTGNSVTNVSNTVTTLTPAGIVVTGSTGTSVSQNAVSTIAGSGSSDIPFGMSLGSSTGMTISSNTVDTVTNSSSGDPVGIALGTGFVSSTVTRNIITNVAYTGTGGYGGRGFEINTGSAASNLTISNNVIANIKGDGWSSFASDSIAGIRVTGTTGGLNFWFNSVNLGSGTFAGNSSGTLSAAMYLSSGTTAVDMRDNVFATNLVNSAASTAKTYAIYSEAAASAFTTINYNDYFGTGTQGVLGFLGSAQSTIALWRTATTQDVNSFASDPLFGSSTNLVPQSGSPLLGAGQTIGAVTTDILGATRNSPPSVGAYENGSDTTGPAISYAALASTTSTSNRTLTATITDATGVPTSGTGLPVLYLKKNAGSYFASQGSFVSGSTYTFTLNYTLVGGVTAGDTISYYIAAQDTVGTPNVSVFPATGAAGFSANPPAVSTPPTTPSSYSIVASISGVKTICASGCNYATLTGAGGAFAAINGAVATGSLELQIAGDLTVGEDGSNGLNPLTEEPAGSNFTVRIYPTGAARAVTGSSATSLIRLNAADRVTLDGSVGGTGNDRSLTVTNTSSTISSAVVWLQSNGADGATSNTIKNLTVVGSNTFGSSVNGTLFGIGSGAGAPRASPAWEPATTAILSRTTASGRPSTGSTRRARAPRARTPAPSSRRTRSIPRRPTAS